jgi:hypothetical protein
VVLLLGGDGNFGTRGFHGEVGHEGGYIL